MNRESEILAQWLEEQPEIRRRLIDLARSAGTDDFPGNAALFLLSNALQEEVLGRNPLVFTSTRESAQIFRILQNVEWDEIALSLISHANAK